MHDWRKLRTDFDSRDAAFEELVCQLARRFPEAHETAEFVRNGPGADAGVECYWRLQDGTEWGWQAKFYERAAQIKWGEIDKSVATALSEHKQLTRYFVALPANLPGGAQPAAARKLWDTHKAKWTKQAATREMSVSFELWDDSRIDELILPEEMTGFRKYWFDETALTRNWFQEQSDRSAFIAGTRYIPDVHIDTTTLEVMEAFGLGDEFVRGIRQLSLGAVRSRVAHDAEAVADVNDLTQKANLLLRSFEARGALSAASTILNHLQQIELAIGRLEGLWASAPDEQESRIRSDVIAGMVRDVREVRDRLVDEAGRAARSQFLLMVGDAGSGKTHLSCELTRRRVSAGQPAITLFGTQFNEHDDVRQQILQILDLSQWKFSEFMQALSCSAERSGAVGTLTIDAINEGVAWHRWANGQLASLMFDVQRQPNVRLLITSRSSYAWNLPHDLREQFEMIYCEGFGDRTLEAIYTYFEHFGIDLPTSPPLHLEFSNPLLLSLACRAAAATGGHALSGHDGMLAIVDSFAEAVEERYTLQRVDQYQPTPPIGRLLARIADELLTQSYVEISEPRLQTIATEMFGNDAARVIGFVEREGMLRSDFRYDRDSQTPEKTYSFGFQLLQDYYLASGVLRSHTRQTLIAKIASSNTPVARQVLSVLSVLLPEREGQELTGLLQEPFAESVIPAVVAALPWRASWAFGDAAESVMTSLCSTQQGLRAALPVLIRLALRPGIALNATYLSKQLDALSMSDRDAVWGLWCADEWLRRQHLRFLVEWVLRHPESLTVEVAGLSAMTLGYLGLSHVEGLRGRAIRALTRLLVQQPSQLGRLLTVSVGVDDPWYRQGVLLAAYGAAMLSQSAPRSLEALASQIQTHFSESAVPVDIVARDSAAGILDIAAATGIEIADAATLKPPYGSEWPALDVRSRAELDSEYRTPAMTWDTSESNYLHLWRPIFDDVVDDFGKRFIQSDAGSSFPWLPIPLTDRLVTNRTMVRRFMGQLTPSQLEQFEALRDASSMLEMRGAPRSREARQRAVRRAQSLPPGTLRRLSKGAGNPWELWRRLHSHFSQAFVSSLRGQTRDEYSKRIAGAMADDAGDLFRPRFDTDLLARWVFERAVQRGWTPDRFGANDKRADDDRGRRRATRVSLKYARIALEEAYARIADNFHLRGGRWSNEAPQKYSGLWNVEPNVRPLDPSVTPGVVETDEEAEDGWWERVPFRAWRLNQSADAWVKRHQEFPSISDVLSPRDSGGRRWCMVSGYLRWKAGTDVHRGERQVWLTVASHLVPAAQSQKWRRRLRAKNMLTFSGRSHDMQDLLYGHFPSLYGRYMGEYPLGVGMEALRKQVEGQRDQIAKEQGIDVWPGTVSYHWESASSADLATMNSDLPSPLLVELFGARTGPQSGSWVDQSGNVVMQDPSVNETGRSALLVDGVALQRVLNDWRLFVTVRGEKLPVGFAGDAGESGRAHLHGVYELLTGTMDGEVWTWFESYGG